jgi:hypothetical protein
MQQAALALYSKQHWHHAANSISIMKQVALSTCIMQQAALATCSKQHWQHEARSIGGPHNYQMFACNQGTLCMLPTVEVCS